MEEKKESGYIPHAFTITGISDELCEYLEKIGIARRIYPQMMNCEGIENERQVDTDEPRITSDRSILMNQELRAKRDDIEKRLKEHDAKRKFIEAELLALQHVCPHEDVKSWSDGGGYGGPGWESYYWFCNDCGLQRVT